MNTENKKTDVYLVISRGVLPLNIIDNHTKKNCRSAVLAYALRKNENRAILFSVGGIFQPKEIQTVPIAILMKSYMSTLRHNNRAVSKEILFEDRSLDTWQNIEEFKRVILENNIDIENIYIFADSFHSVRVEMLLKYHGFKNIYRMSSNINLTLKEKIKESILIIMTFLDPSGIKNPVIKWRLQEERKLRSKGEINLVYQESK